MQFKVHGMNVGLTPSLVEHIEGRLSVALDGFSERIRQVIVRLSRDHSHEDSHEMTLKVQVDMGGVGTVYLEQDEHDLYAAVDMAATRLKRSVRRKINRQRDKQRPLGTGSASMSFAW
ncbi:ribosome-associated translation inhibitor RaiA [Planctomycetota bacterium]|nr:ribosome-associated translation inhibitor RaiA [Planctomycetota bacterium]